MKSGFCLGFFGNFNIGVCLVYFLNIEVLRGRMHGLMRSSLLNCLMRLPLLFRRRRRRGGLNSRNCGSRVRIQKSIHRENGNESRQMEGQGIGVEHG